MLLTFGVFAAWTLIGLGMLVALRVDTRELVPLLTAPALGVSVVTLTTFFLSRAGLPVHDFAVAETAVLLVAAAAVVAWRRPPVVWQAALPVALALAAMLLAGRPMFEFGFRWIANANDDMANYVLAAERLFRHSFLAPVSVDQFVAGRDYTAAAQGFQTAGARPGSQLTLAWLQGVSGRTGQQAFMPLIIALHGCCVCAVAALAAQSRRRRLLAATIGAALFAIAPLATFGIVQQLLGQAFGLAIGAALVAVLMRPELYERDTNVADIAVVGLLTAALVLTYVEIGAILFVAYLAFIAWLALRRALRWPAAAKLWAGSLVVTLILLNTYTVSLVEFLSNQGRAGTGRSGLFVFMLVPSAVPAVFGVQKIPFDGLEDVSLWISCGIAILIAVVVVLVGTVRRGYAAAFVLLAGAAMAAMLIALRADFGVFKLAMWLQPFIGATVAVGFADARRRRVQQIAAVALVLWLFPAWDAARGYVNASRNPVELRNGSAETVLPAFRHAVRSADGPVLSATTNPVLAKLEASTAIGHRVLFVGRELFRNLTEGLSSGEREAALRRGRWTRRVFALPGPHRGGARRNAFNENPLARAAFRRQDCTLVVPSGSQAIVNRRRFPEGTRDLIARSCASARNELLFISSALGQSYYLANSLKDISFYQLENDSYFAGRTFSAAGRYALLQILRPAKRIRLCIAFTRTLARDGGNLLPPATVAGTARATLPMLGRGSARVCSTNVTPRQIAGKHYVMLDMGIAGRSPDIPRPGLLGLYGRDEAIDPRYLTGYVRDVSLVTEAQYRRLRPALALRAFPESLQDDDLEYSGIYEDGWVGERSYAVLAPGSAGHLVVAGETYGGQRQLGIAVDGRQLASRRVGPGTFEMRVRAPGSSRRRRVELRFSSSASLPNPDGRPASARLSFLGFVP